MGVPVKFHFPAYAATTMYETLFDEWYITGYGAVLKALGNKDLTWEKTDKLSVGIETKTFHNRLTVGFLSITIIRQLTW